jgi:eukaryotic-like serine/threonine-protein kinase
MVDHRLEIEYTTKSMPPKQVNNCDIIGEIGAGGMAVIYKAVQNSLNRPVAIKELKNEFSNDPQLVARFIREATALAALQHENIVHIYDFVKEENTFRMVMEFVEGIDLFDLLDKVHHLPPDVGAVIGFFVCNALEYAHYRGIIHRDIKPSNIIISRKGEVKLMDFGIARDEKMGDLTRPGTSLGTPAYMSPEQIMGVKIDFRSDIFSFGIVLYQMLTGTKPFTESGARSIMHKILNGEFTKPRRINPNIPRNLERIILRCLAKEPDARYQSTGALRQELEDYLAKRVELNFSGRLLMYLFHKGIVNREEAETFLPVSVFGDKEILRADENMPPPPSLKTIAWVQGTIGLALAIWFFTVQWMTGTIRTGSDLAGPPGALKVVALPWAEIYIDGAFVETTPVARSFSLTPGVHEVLLKNPNFEPVIQKVLIEPARLQKIKVTLEQRK